MAEDVPRKPVGGEEGSDVDERDARFAKSPFREIVPDEFPQAARKIIGFHCRRPVDRQQGIFLQKLRQCGIAVANDLRLFVAPLENRRNTPQIQRAASQQLRDALRRRYFLLAIRRLVLEQQVEGGLRRQVPERERDGPVRGPEHNVARAGRGDDIYADALGKSDRKRLRKGIPFAQQLFETLDIVQEEEHGARSTRLFQQGVANLGPGPLAPSAFLAPVPLFSILVLFEAEIIPDLDPVVRNAGEQASKRLIPRFDVLHVHLEDAAGILHAELRCKLAHQLGLPCPARPRDDREATRGKLPGHGLQQTTQLSEFVLAPHEDGGRRRAHSRIDFDCLARIALQRQQKSKPQRVCIAELAGEVSELGHEVAAERLERLVQRLFRGLIQVAEEHVEAFGIPLAVLHPRVNPLEFLPPEDPVVRAVQHQPHLARLNHALGVGRIVELQLHPDAPMGRLQQIVDVEHRIGKRIPLFCQLFVRREEGRDFPHVLVRRCLPQFHLRHPVDKLQKRRAQFLHANPDAVAALRQFRPQFRRIGIRRAIGGEENAVRLEPRPSLPLPNQRLVQLLPRVHSGDVPEEHERRVAVVHFIEIAVLGPRFRQPWIHIFPLRQPHPKPPLGDLLLLRQHKIRQIVAFPLQLLRRCDEDSYVFHTASHSRSRSFFTRLSLNWGCRLRSRSQSSSDSFDQSHLSANWGFLQSKLAQSPPLSISHGH